MIVYHEFMEKYPHLFSNEDALIKIISDPQVISKWQTDRKMDLLKEGSPIDWADLGVILDDKYFIVIKDLVEFPTGEMNGYCRIFGQANLRGGQGVVVLPEYEGKILLLHQYRHPTRQWHYEVPRGYGEPNTPAEENARKEIEEETGGVVGELTNLGEFYNNTGLEGHSVTLFHANLTTVGKPNRDEGIESYTYLTTSELEDWIASGKVTDGFTIAAYTKAKLKGLLS